METRKILTVFALLAGSAVRLSAVEVYSFNNINAVLPDGQPAGYSDVRTISSGITQIGSVQVNLNIVGNFNGDVYCYLQHGSAISVLLNRAGRTSGNAFGYNDAGFNVTFSDSAANGNIHTYRNVFTPPGGSALTGFWQPDGRSVNPMTVLDTDPVNARLNVFNGLDANGGWTLFLADMSSGGNNLLSSWQLIITPVPEPSSIAVLALGLGLVCAKSRRRK
jgi:subtilisin-like proprotein convertase family protein